MINIPKNFKKKVFHILTSGNADIAFYTEAFVAGNKERVMKNQIKFGIDLLKINIKCRLPHGKYTIEGLSPGKKCISRIYRRAKVYQYAKSLIRYPCIITDIFGSLIELIVDMDSIYQKIEQEYRLPGFYKLRKKKENPYKTITSIYEEISKELGTIITKDAEINMLERNVLFNPYIKKVFEIASYNQNDIIGILESSYSKEDIKTILGEFSTVLSDIWISSEEKLSFHKMRKKVIRTYKSKGSEKAGEQFAVISGNYSKAIKNVRKGNISPVYYRSPKDIMKSIPMPELTKEFKEIYQTIAGVELFNGLYNHKNIYEISYLYLAPAIYALLEQTYQKALINESKVIALCDSESIFVKLYEKYFGKLCTCIWSGFAGAILSTKEEWNNLIEECNFVASCQANTIAHSYGFSFKPQPLRNCKEEFIDEALKKAKVKDKEVIKSYIKNHLGKEKSIVVVDPMPGLTSIDYFCKYVKEIDSQIEIEQVSMSQFLKKDAGELQLFYKILQMDIPYVMGFYGDQPTDSAKSNAQLTEISFIQPKLVDEIKKKVIYGAVEDFCRDFAAYKRKNKKFEMVASDVNSLLDYSKEGLLQLEEELGGWIE